MYDDNVYRQMEFEDDTGDVFDLNEFDLPINFLSNIFNGKASTDEALI